MTKTWTRTQSGKKIDPLAIQPRDIDIEDIAHSLSNQCRYNGHCRKFYSVAEHSVLVSYLVSDASRFHALLHDASEAYLGDMVSPLKHAPEMEAFRRIEADCMRTIWLAFGVRLPVGKIEAEIHAADKSALYVEVKALFDNSRLTQIIPRLDGGQIHAHVHALPPEEAHHQFMKRYRELRDV